MPANNDNDDDEENGRCQRLLSAPLEYLGGRRFVMAMLAALAATALQWCGKLDAAGSTYALVIIGTVAAYITGNTVQKGFQARPQAPEAEK